MKVFSLVANTYLLDTPEGPLLVDSGLPGENRKLLGHLGDMKPAALLLTHHHLDHVGGARMLWERLRLPIYAHPLDIPFICGVQRRPPFPPIPWLGDWVANSPKPVPGEALRPVDEGALVMCWQWCTYRVAPGQTGLYKQGVLIAADALRVGPRGPLISPAMVNHDTAEARRTAGKIARLDVQIIHVGHGPPTTPEAVRALALRLGV